MSREPINDLARRQILAAAEQALRHADALGVVPTPLDEVADGLGVEAVIDISELPEEEAIKKPSALRKILGAYLFPAKTAFVDFSQPEGRARFIQAHELGHRVVPWHEGAFLDDERRLFQDTEELLEDEAKLAAAHLIFQYRPFFERALEFPLSLRTPILLADTFKASLHATIRYYVEDHPEPVAVVIAGRYRRMDGTVPIFLGAESPTFRERFGAVIGRFPTRALPLGETRPLGPLLLEAGAAVEPPSAPVVLRDLNGEQQRFVAEAFFNQRCYFLMFAPARRFRVGRRIKVQAG